MKQFILAHRKTIFVRVVILVIVGSLVALSMNNRSGSVTFYYNNNDSEEYILNNGLQLYLNYESVLKIMGEPESIKEYSVGDGTLYPAHHYYILNYNGISISMLYIDRENTGKSGIEHSRAEQIQIFSSDYSTTKNSAVGQTAKKLESAYGFASSLEASQITESLIGHVFVINIEDGAFSNYDSLYYIATSTDVYQDQETKGLLFLMNSDRISSIVIFNPRPIVMTPKLY